MHARIQCLVNLFPPGNTLIDIGSDHGYLGLELLKSHKTDFVLNVDLSAKSLKDSRRIYEKQGLQERAKFICGDGFKPLEEIPENSIAVIAGMGTALILRILSLIPDKIRGLVLMSHTDYLLIRRWAVANKWTILKEKYVDDNGYFYMGMMLVRSKKVRDEYSLQDYIFGKQMFRDECPDMFAGFWREKSSRILKIPAKYRTEEEREAIRFLIEKGIIEKPK